MALMGALAAVAAPAAAQRDPVGGAPTPDQVRRMQWWHAAKFGMFIHFGLYAGHQRHEWAMENEAIPVSGIPEILLRFITRRRGVCRAWAKLAKAAVMKYMVLTSKHWREAFLQLGHQAPPTITRCSLAPRRDVTGEYVEAARAEGLRVGFYYSLMDWYCL